MEKIETKKKCSGCLESKSIDLFGRRSLSKDNLDYYCKNCRVITNLKSHNNINKKKRCSVESCNKQHYALSYCRPHHAKFKRHGVALTDFRYLKLDETYVRENGSRYNKEIHLRRKFNLEMKDYISMSKNGCMICGDNPDVPLYIDHDHSCCDGRYKTCGQCIRGAVCSRCNMLIGKYERNIIRKDNKLYDKIKQYLDNYKKKRHE